MVQQAVFWGFQRVPLFHPGQQTSPQPPKTAHKGTRKPPLLASEANARRVASIRCSLHSRAPRSTRHASKRGEAWLAGGAAGDTGWAALCRWAVRLAALVHIDLSLRRSGHCVCTFISQHAVINAGSCAIRRPARQQLHKGISLLLCSHPTPAGRLCLCSGAQAAAAPARLRVDCGCGQAGAGPRACATCGQLHSAPGAALERV